MSGSRAPRRGALAIPTRRAMFSTEGRHDLLKIRHIDRQHRQIVDIIDQLYPLDKEKEHKVMSDVSAKLMSYFAARAAADRILFVDEGVIIEDTTPEQLFTNPREERTKLFLSKILN